MNNKKIEYTMFAEMYDFDFEQAYGEKLRGVSWRSLADKKCNQGTMASMMEAWCKDHDKDFEILKTRGVGILNDAKCVDSGRVYALRKARWSIADIAVDCHCTEECVKEILNEL